MPDTLLIPHHPWIFPDSRTFEFENPYSIQINGIPGLITTQIKDTLDINGRTVQIADPNQKRVVKVFKGSAELFSLQLDTAISAEIGYCGEYSFLLVGRTETFLMIFTAEFSGNALDGNYLHGFASWASPTQLPIEFGNPGLSISFPSPYSASWIFSGSGIPPTLNDFPRSGSVSLSQNSIPYVYDPYTLSFTGGRYTEAKWNNSRLEFINYTSPAISNQYAEKLKWAGSFSAIEMRRNPKWINERILLQGTFSDEIPLSSSSTRSESSPFVQTAFLLEKLAQEECEIPIQQLQIYTPNEHFCLSRNEYNNLITRLNGIQQNLNRRR